MNANVLEAFWSSWDVLGKKFFRKTEFRFFSLDNTPIAVTETWLDDSIPDSVLQYHDTYDIFRRDRPSRGGDVAIFAKKCIKGKSLKSAAFGDLEIVVVQAKFRGQRVIFACFYRG